jgi:hypothetical protein
VGINENDGGGEGTYDIRTFVNVTMYPSMTIKKSVKGEK